MDKIGISFDDLQQFTVPANPVWDVPLQPKDAMEAAAVAPVQSQLTIDAMLWSLATKAAVPVAVAPSSLSTPDVRVPDDIALRPSLFRKIVVSFLALCVIGGSVAFYLYTTDFLLFQNIKKTIVWGVAGSGDVISSGDIPTPLADEIERVKSGVWGIQDEEETEVVANTDIEVGEDTENEGTGTKDTTEATDAFADLDDAFSSQEERLVGLLDRADVLEEKSKKVVEKAQEEKDKKKHAIAQAILVNIRKIKEWSEGETDVDLSVMEQSIEDLETLYTEKLE